jgi:hypothetical protein
MVCGVDEHLWNGVNLRPPMMHFDEVMSLDVLITEGDKPKVSFGRRQHAWLPKLVQGEEFVSCKRFAAHRLMVTQM